MALNIFKKEYIAVVEGILEKPLGTISEPIARKENSIIERCISPNGDSSITHFEVLKIYTEKNISLVKFFLETGRTHQIRVHSKHIGHPIVGDTLYGHKSEFISRQALHSHIVKFVHPITKEAVQYTAPIPNDILNIYSL